MRIHAFVQHYPSPYKPYYDAQFADLLRKGHALAIFATADLDRVHSAKVQEYGLARRTSYVPGTLRELPRHLPRLAGAAAGLGAAAPARVRRVLGRAAGGKAGLLAASRALALGRGEPDLCLVHGLGTASLFPWLRLAFPGVPVALYYHGGEVPLAPQVAADVAADAFGAADIVFTNTAFSRRQAIERGCAPERVAVLPVGFALEDYVPARPRAYRPGGRLRLVSAGRVSEEKGFLHALEALRRVVEQGETRVSYSIAGDGYQRPRLAAFVREHGLAPYVELTGVLPHPALIDRLGHADALLLPSVPLGNWAETQACAVQEGLLMGALAVTTRMGGVPESIPPEMRRFAVAPGDPAALARVILELTTMSEGEMRRLAERGSRFVAERYDIRQLNDELLERTLATRPGAALRPEPAPLRSALGSGA